MFHELNNCEEEIELPMKNIESEHSVKETKDQGKQAIEKIVVALTKIVLAHQKNLKMKISYIN